MEVKRMQIEVSFRVKDLRDALKSLFALKPKGELARIEYVDLNATNDEVELVMTGMSSTFPAEVQTGGYARIPYLAFERLSLALKTLPAKPLSLSIGPGQLKVGTFTFNHSGITLRPIGARIADLPVNPSLLDVLSLLVRFREEELEDSGLLPRVMEAQKEAADLIDSAASTLSPVGVTRQALSQFVQEQLQQLVRTQQS
jgi:hypothetical protein